MSTPTSVTFSSATSISASASAQDMLLPEQPNHTAPTLDHLDLSNSKPDHSSHENRVVEQPGLVPDQGGDHVRTVPVPGTPGFLVDGPWTGTDTRQCRSWFLSHFEPAVCRGLGKGFTLGNIYCTHITARLLRELLVRFQVRHIPCTNTLE